MIYFELFLIALLSGLFGRMGGAGKSGQWYENILDSKWRDWGCSALAVLATGLWFQWAGPWWAYGLIFCLHWGAFSLYWDELFGYDNFWFSGAMVGLACIPIVAIDSSLWWFVALRSVLLCIIWGCLNKYLPQRVWIWGRDVVEENVRYTVSL